MQSRSADPHAMVDIEKQKQKEKTKTKQCLKLVLDGVVVDNMEVQLVLEKEMNSENSNQSH